jgi:hypothetical protein
MTEGQNPLDSGRDDVSIAVVPIGEMIPDVSNVRKRDDRAKRSLAASLAQFGPARSIVLDGKGIVRAGNGTLEAAQEAGVSEVLVVKPRPGQLVAVQREDWSATEATGYAIADNQIATLASWREQELAEQLEALRSDDFDLEAVGFTGDEVSKLIEGLGDEILAEDEWPEHGAPESHSVVVRYRDEDIPALMGFLGESDESILAGGRAGAKILERIREVAPR